LLLYRFYKIGTTLAVFARAFFARYALSRIAPNRCLPSMPAIGPRFLGRHGSLPDLPLVPWLSIAENS